MGLTARLIAALVICGALIFSAVFSFNYSYTSRMVERQAEAHARDVVRAAVQSIDDLLREVAYAGDTLARQLEGEATTLAEELLEQRLLAHLAANDKIYGSTVALEPEAFGGREVAPYYYRDTNVPFRYVNLATPNYNYTGQDWYQRPKEAQAPSWSEPYFDEGGGNVVMTTYSVPLFRPEGEERRFVGVATADISLEWLSRQVSSLQLHYNGYAALFSRRGVFLAHPDPALVLREDIFSVARRLKSAGMQQIGQGITRQQAGFVKTTNVFGVASWIYYAPVPTTGWSLGVVFPEKALLADVRAASRMIALCCVGGFFLLVLAIVLVARGVTRPIVEMTAAAERIAGGDLATELPPVSIGGEVGALAAAFASMQADLRDYITRLTETTAAKERMASELAIARELQMAMLPRQLPRLREVDLCGVCQPAREVGGDLYDVRQLDDGRLFFLIGDVSGKGVPASLYMAITVSLARALIRDQFRPADIMTRINRELARDNESCMFVTIFCGIFDPGSGEIRYANAGHPPPLLVGADGIPTVLAITPEPAAGYLEDYDYHEGACSLADGASLVLYTDGVTEAMDVNEAFFGEQRLLAAAAAQMDKAGAEGLVASVQEALTSFSLGAAQADDITLLALHRQPRDTP
ncbi:MAG: hypothetical protein BWK76_20570 [Desulfobulbaceae bacterium A2]|nr:MAG: hypothetical protein BWK76_20570 [Desulfobulbaceae bacterium A2]